MFCKCTHTFKPDGANHYPPHMHLIFNYGSWESLHVVDSLRTLSATVFQLRPSIRDTVQQAWENLHTCNDIPRNSYSVSSKRQFILNMEIFQNVIRSHLQLLMCLEVQNFSYYGFNSVSLRTRADSSPAHISIRLR